MSSCALDGCPDPGCSVCSVNRRFPTLAACGRAIDGKTCRLVAGHRYRCQPERRDPVEQAEPKAKAPVQELSEPRAAAAALAYKPRKRVGPHR